MDFKQAALQRLAMMRGDRGQTPFGTTQPVVTDILPTGKTAPQIPGQRPPFVPASQSQGLPEGAGTLGKIGDPRGMAGMFSRGANVYNGGSMAAHQGPNVNMGRPSMKDIAMRRLMMQQGGR